MQSVLTITSNEASLAAINATLTARGFRARGEGRATDGLASFRDQGADLVVVALPVADMPADRLLAELRGQDPRVGVILAGKDCQIAGAPDALDLGALEYVADPVGDPEGLAASVLLVLGTRESDVQLRFLRQKDSAGAAWQSIIATCPEMRQVLGQVRSICLRTMSGGTPAILIVGETGTGKGLLAKAIHYGSGRRSRAFVDINCAAIPAGLVEGELFGYERGAFTDAHTSRPGLLETASGGTLFLDEVGSLPLEIQAKLLVSIEEKHVRRLGARESRRIDVQIVAATHRDLGLMVRCGEFRADLYHRLNVVAVALPPLRQRGPDRCLIAEALVRAMCRDYGIPGRALAEDTRAAIERYSWPGNIRELRNQLERILLLEDDAVIRAAHLRLDKDASAPVHVDVREREGEIEVTLPPQGCDLDGLERAVLRRALAECQGNVSRAARFLHITRQTLIYRMRKHGLVSQGDVDTGAGVDRG